MSRRAAAIVSAAVAASAMTAAVMTAPAVGTAAVAVHHTAAWHHSPATGHASSVVTSSRQRAVRPLEYLHIARAGTDGLAQLDDPHGRGVLLRGVNVDGLVDYYRPDLRPPYPSHPAAYRHGRCPADDPSVEGVPLCSFDLPQMRPLGYDAIRLNVSWSLLEPHPGHLDRGYVDRIAQVVHWAHEQGIYVVIDMHQDAWSKYVSTPRGSSCPPATDATRGYDGAPRWASTHRLPACAVDNTRELDLAVQEDAQDFWSDLPGPDGVGLQEHYAHVVAVLAHRFAHDPTVAGYDLMNEPEPGFVPEAEVSSELLPFDALVARTIRSSTPHFRQLLFLEPGVERNTTAQRAAFAPWSAYSPYRNAVYAPHVYTDVFTTGALTGTPETTTFRSDYDAAAADARALGLPLWVGEFGGPPASDRTVLAQHYAQQESRRIGGTMWLWKENANDTIGNTFWGIYGPPFRGATTRGRVQPARVRRTSRVYPLLTAGVLRRAVSDPYAGTALVRASAHRVRQGDRSRGTLVDVPKVFRGRIVVRGAGSTVVRRSGAREVWLYPRGGAYSLEVVSGGSSKLTSTRSKPF